MKKIMIVIGLLIGVMVIGQFFKKKMASRVSAPVSKEVFNASPSDAKVQLDTDQRLADGPVVKEETTCSAQTLHSFCHLFKFGGSNKSEGVILDTNRITIYADIRPYLAKIDEFGSTATDTEERWILAFGELLLEKIDTSILPYARAEDFYAGLQLPQGDKIKDTMVIQVPIGGLPALHAFYKAHLIDHIKGAYPDFFDEIRPFMIVTKTQVNFQPTNRLKKVSVQKLKESVRR